MLEIYCRNSRPKFQIFTKFELIEKHAPCFRETTFVQLAGSKSKKMRIRQKSKQNRGNIISQHDKATRIPPLVVICKIGMILDSKLDYRLKIELRVKRACIVFYTCTYLHKKMGSPAENGSIDVRSRRSIITSIG